MASPAPIPLMTGSAMGANHSAESAVTARAPAAPSDSTTMRVTPAVISSRAAAICSSRSRSSRPTHWPSSRTLRFSRYTPPRSCRSADRRCRPRAAHPSAPHDRRAPDRNPRRFPVGGCRWPPEGLRPLRCPPQRSGSAVAPATVSEAPGNTSRYWLPDAASSTAKFSRVGPVTGTDRIGTLVSRTSCSSSPPVCPPAGKTRRGRIAQCDHRAGDVDTTPARIESRCLTPRFVRRQQSLGAADDIDRRIHRQGDDRHHPSPVTPCARRESGIPPSAAGHCWWSRAACR